MTSNLLNFVVTSTRFADDPATLNIRTYESSALVKLKSLHAFESFVPNKMIPQI